MKSHPQLQYWISEPPDEPLACRVIPFRWLLPMLSRIDAVRREVAAQQILPQAKE